MGDAFILTVDRSGGVSKKRVSQSKHVLASNRCQKQVCFSLYSAGAIAGCGILKSAMHEYKILESLQINSVPLALNSAYLH